MATLETVLAALLQERAADPSTCTAIALLKGLKTNPTWAALTRS